MLFMDSQKEVIVKTQSLSLAQHVIMPTQRDLKNSQRFNIDLPQLSPFAIFVNKMSSKDRVVWASNFSSTKKQIQKACQDYNSYDFLVNFQYKNKTIFSQQEMNYFEAVQQIPELKKIAMNEKDAGQTALLFEQQLMKRQTGNKTKRIVPFIEANTNQVMNKVAVMKRKGINVCAVISRGYNEDYAVALSRTLNYLKVAGIYSAVVGVYPKKWATTQATLLLPPLQFEANAISSWIAWRGAPTNMQLLCFDWIYRDLASADMGLSTYNQQDRKSFIANNNNLSFNTAFGQIDAINQAGLLARNFITLPKIQFESLFN